MIINGDTYSEHSTSRQITCEYKSDVEASFDWWDRIKILFGAKLKARCKLKLFPDEVSFPAEGYSPTFIGPKPVFNQTMIGSSFSIQIILK